MRTIQSPSVLKTLLPAAVLSCLAASSLPAQAQQQSSLVIYGIIDAGLSHANNGTTSLLTKGTNDTWVERAGNTSRLGFKGYEDMGGGNYARFQLEHRFASDTGAPSNATVFWLGRSVVAVGGKWGEVYGGREYSPAYWIALEVDPTYQSYVSQLGIPYTYANYTAVASTVEASNIRWANAVGYKSPNFGGLTFELQGALGENARPNNKAGNVTYKNGPLWLAAGFDYLNTKNHLALIGAEYDFGVVQPTISYAKAKGGLNGDAKSYSLGLKVPVSFGRVYVQAGRYAPASGLDSTMFGAGTEYSLSKRTVLYANLGTAKQDKQTRSTAIDFGIKQTF